MLPDPALSITIPSVHDDATLECRIYHPQSLAANPRAPPWRKHAAVIAHPYAPLGGCYDDPVVETLAVTLLREGFLVGTFNFRGAGNSGGRTSWTSKAERSDYTSFLGFVYYYVHYLDPFTKGLPTLPLSPTTVQPSTHDASGSEPVGKPFVLLQCGYSYGAMITKQLPPLSSMMEIFVAPKSASAAADIRLRAQHLAEQQNVILSSARAALMEPASPMSPRRATRSLRIGGDEDKRRSQDHGGRRSFAIDAEEKVRAGVAELLKKTKMHQIHGHRKKGNPPDENDAAADITGEEADKGKGLDDLPPVAGLPSPMVAYLLVSPPVGWATSLMTMNLGSPVSGLFGKHHARPKNKDREEQAAGAPAAESKQERQKLVENPTLAIYGDSDVFVAVKKFRDWASKLQSAPASRFRAHEVSTAGHFYVEEGTMQRLADAVRAFSRELLAKAEDGP